MSSSQRQAATSQSHPAGCVEESTGRKDLMAGAVVKYAKVITKGEGFEHGTLWRSRVRTNHQNELSAGIYESGCEKVQAFKQFNSWNTTHKPRAFHSYYGGVQ